MQKSVFNATNFRFWTPDGVHKVQIVKKKDSWVIKIMKNSWLSSTCLVPSLNPPRALEVVCGAWSTYPSSITITICWQESFKSLAPCRTENVLVPSVFLIANRLKFSFWSKKTLSRWNCMRTEINRYDCKSDCYHERPFNLSLSISLSPISRLFEKYSTTHCGTPYAPMIYLMMFVKLIYNVNILLCELYMINGSNYCNKFTVWYPQIAVSEKLILFPLIFFLW